MSGRSRKRARKWSAARNSNSPDVETWSWGSPDFASVSVRSPEWTRTWPQGSNGLRFTPMMSKMSSRQLRASFWPFRKKLTFCRKVHPGDSFGRLRHDFRPKSLAVVAVILVEWFYVTRESFAKISKNALHEDRDGRISRIWRYFGVTRYFIL